MDLADRRETVADTLLAGARRELCEELEGGVPLLRFLGVINEDVTRVGTVHLGLAFVGEISDGARPAGGPKLLGSLEWLAPAEATGRELERWSRLALALLLGLPLYRAAIA